MLQSLVGWAGVAPHLRRWLCATTHGDRILHIDRGRTDNLEYLPQVEFHGFDMNEGYDATARKRHGKRAGFFCQRVDEEVGDLLNGFDIAIARGIAYHLDDRETVRLFQTAHIASQPGAGLLTLGGVLASGQSYSHAGDPP